MNLLRKYLLDLEGLKTVHHYQCVVLNIGEDSTENARASPTVMQYPCHSRKSISELKKYVFLLYNEVKGNYRIRQRKAGLGNFLKFDDKLPGVTSTKSLNTQQKLPVQPFLIW